MPPAANGACALRVLYVEDYAPVAALVRETMRRRAPEIELDIATTVAQAIELLERSARSTARGPHYDAVLTDLKLPDGHGLDVLAHVRRRGWPMAVVILTASPGDAGKIGGLQADGHVPKRDDYLARLPDALRAAVGRFRADAGPASQP